MIILASVLADLATALTLGGMVFFSVVIAPTVFTALEAATAARFIRRLFPNYYAFVAATALVAGLAFLPHAPVLAAVMLAVAVSTLAARQILMPRINAARDQGLAGDAAANHRFERGHRLSVALNAIQLLATLGVLVTASLPT
ncbi:MAG: DUF4149 domain-containing protein [Alphaproteobacteria bacterium]|nr:MAG: DUF4149 domain-containing protein [Alphaproteobacteria bacterium]